MGKVYYRYYTFPFPTLIFLEYVVPDYQCVEYIFWLIDLLIVLVDWISGVNVQSAPAMIHRLSFRHLIQHLGYSGPYQTVQLVPFSAGPMIEPVIFIFCNFLNFFFFFWPE